MSLEEGKDLVEELTEDALALRVYQLKTLHELNQDMSRQGSLREVLELSLPSIIGVFGLRRGLMSIYKDGRTAPREFVYRGMRKDTAARWFQQLETHLKRPYSREICVAEDATCSPLAGLLKDYNFRVWLPLEVDEQTWGGIALGEKLSEAAFTEDDLEFLSTTAINIQNVLSNVSLIEALNQAVTKERRISTIFQRYAPESVVNEVLNPSNEELLLGESQAVQHMFEEMIGRLEEQHALEQDLDLAREVQEYLLPGELPRIPGIGLDARSIPARGVCGDFYDFIPLGPYEVGLSLADVSGKGMPAAMIAAMLQSATRMCVGNYYPIPATLCILNRFVLRNTDPARYATMFYGHLDGEKRTLTYSNAGHPPAILCRSGEVKLMEAGGLPVGSFDACSYDQEQIQLQRGDALVIYSDGVTDAGTTPDSPNPEDAFGPERLEAAIVANANLSAGLLLDAICEEVSHHTAGNKQFDDITMMVMKVE